MSNADTDINLAGQFLLAMPGMGDPRFERSVIYMLAHDHEGAMGFIVNRPTDGLTLGEMASNLPPAYPRRAYAIYRYLSEGRCSRKTALFYIQQTPDWLMSEPVSVTQSLDILVQAAEGKGPQHMRLVLGYAGWGPGQLENEIQDNAWLIVEADIGDVFAANTEALYKKLIGKLGIDFAMLSNSGGEA